MRYHEGTVCHVSPAAAGELITTRPCHQHQPLPLPPPGVIWPQLQLSGWDETRGTSAGQRERLWLTRSILSCPAVASREMWAAFTVSGQSIYCNEMKYQFTFLTCLLTSIVSIQLASWRKDLQLRIEKGRRVRLNWLLLIELLISIDHLHFGTW